MPFPVTNPGTAPSWSSATNWGDIRWNINSQLDLIAKYYDKPTIDDMLAQLWGSGKMVVVDVLPATWEDWFIYLISHDGTWNPPFDMYIWTENNTFQLIWDTTIDLSNVYTKEEADNKFQIQLIPWDKIELTETWIINVKNVYNKQEVDDLIEAIDTVKMLVVPELPTIWRVNVIYLVPTANPDVYEQWIWEIDSSVTPPTEWWKQVGTMEIDLSQYYTKTETDDKFLQKKDEKVLVYPFVWIGGIVEDMIDKMKEWKAIVLSTYDEQDPDNAEFWWISEYTDTQFVVERPTQRETYTYDANFEITNISIDDEPPLYRRDYRFWWNETDRLIRNLFTQAKTYNEDTELTLDELITDYSEWMFYKLLVTNNSLTDPITLTLDTGIANPMNLDLTIPAEETVLYMLMRVWNQFNIVWSSYELSGSLSNYYTKQETYSKTETDLLLDEKQDLLHDLWTVGAVVPEYKLAMLDLVWNWLSHINVDTLYNYYKTKLDGAVSNVLEEDFPTPNRAVVSNSQGKFAICDTTTEEINYVHWVTSNVQTQINNKQDTLTDGIEMSAPTDSSYLTDVDLNTKKVHKMSMLTLWNYVKNKITGAVSNILTSNLTASRALVSYSNGKIGVSDTTQTEILYVHGVTSNIQTQLNDMWKKIYPVGAIYISTSSTSPATLFGGTWERINGRFLVGAGSNGATGNEALNLTAGTTGWVYRHQHSYGIKYGAYYWQPTTTSDSTIIQLKNWNTSNTASWKSASQNGNVQGRYSSWSGEGSISSMETTATTNLVNNLPPYLVVYIRKRTA